MTRAGGRVKAAHDIFGLFKPLGVHHDDVNRASDEADGLANSDTLLDAIAGLILQYKQINIAVTRHGAHGH
jgi:hypothetical protein